MSLSAEWLHAIRALTCAYMPGLVVAYVYEEKADCRHDDKNDDDVFNNRYANDDDDFFRCMRGRLSLNTRVDVCVHGETCVWPVCMRRKTIVIMTRTMMILIMLYMPMTIIVIIISILFIICLFVY